MELNRLIDHTNLKADATKEDIINLCNEAKQYHFASVCVNPSYVPLAAEMLKGTDSKVCTVVGFPLGAMLSESKRQEAIDAIKKGAEEIDMVINIGRLKDKDYKYVEDEIHSLKEACGSLILKVIIETCLLTDDEIVQACILAKKAGADFVKTSTGFSKWGAKVKDVELMRKTVGETMGVKASGGVKDKAEALEMVKAGATRIGTSHGIDIVK